MYGKDDYGLIFWGVYVWRLWWELKKIPRDLGLVGTRPARGTPPVVAQAVPAVG